MLEQLSRLPKVKGSRLVLLTPGEKLEQKPDFMERFKV